MSLIDFIQSQRSSRDVFGYISSGRFYYFDQGIRQQLESPQEDGFYTATIVGQNIEHIAPASQLAIRQWTRREKTYRFIKIDDRLGYVASNYSKLDHQIYPVMNLESWELWSTVKAVFLPSGFWFAHSIDNSRSRYRESLRIGELDSRGISSFERDAYGYVQMLQEERRQARERQERREQEERARRIREQTIQNIEYFVNLAGGNYVGHRAIAGGFVVSLDVSLENGTSSRYNPVVDENLNVIRSGICLNGTDNLYDLTTLISVYREGMRRRLVHRM